MERLALLMDYPQESVPDFYLAVLDPAALDQGQILALGLRGHNFQGEVSFEARGPKSQLRLANKLKARFCLLLGTEELENKTIVVKDMQSGDQRTWPQSDLVAALAPKSHTS
jgi:histidyl-tRNA synthetase